MADDTYTPDDAWIIKLLGTTPVTPDEVARWVAAHDARVKTEALSARPSDAEVNLAAMTWAESGPTPASWYGMSAQRRDLMTERMRIVLTALATAHARRADIIEKEAGA